MIFLLIACFLLVPMFFLFCRKLLFKTKMIQYLMIVSFALAIIGVCVPNNLSDNKPNLSLALILPLYDLIILVISLRVFRKIKKRDPRDTGKPKMFLDYDDGFLSDRLFDFVMFTCWLFAPMAMLVFFFT